MIESAMVTLAMATGLAGGAGIGFAIGFGTGLSRGSELNHEASYKDGLNVGILIGKRDKETEILRDSLDHDGEGTSFVAGALVRRQDEAEEDAGPEEVEDVVDDD